MNEDLPERVAALEVRVGVINERQSSIDGKLDELIALKNQGKGSIWILITLGGIIGSIVSDWKSLLHLVKP